MAHETEYEQLLADQKKNKIKIKEKRRELSKAFKKDNKWKMRTLDILFILMILANCGALVLTNALVFKTTPTATVVELNPVAGEVHDFETKEGAEPLYLGVVIHMLAWGLFIAYYLYLRYYIYSIGTYWGVMFFVVVGFTVLFMDFVNDLGYWIGKLIWGT